MECEAIIGLLEKALGGLATIATGLCCYLERERRILYQGQIVMAREAKDRELRVLEARLESVEKK